MNAPSSSEELQRWMDEVGEAVHLRRRASVMSSVWTSGLCGISTAVTAVVLLLLPSSADGSVWLTNLGGVLFTVATAICWGFTSLDWRKRRRLSPDRTPVTVESSIVEGDRLSRTITVGPKGWSCSRSWTETEELPRGEEAVAFVARRAIEDAGWEETMAAGTLPEGASGRGARRAELTSILLEGRALSRRSELEPGREVVT